MGGETTPNQAVAQVAGGALRMTAQALPDEFRRGGPFQLALLRYTQALITQISQTAVCNRLHPVEKRLCRWLLLTHDRGPSDELLMTQEFIAHMLGVRREGVTAAAHHLQEAGLIRYARATPPFSTAPGWRRRRASATAWSRPSSPPAPAGSSVLTPSAGWSADGVPSAALANCGRGSAAIPMTTSSRRARRAYIGVRMKVWLPKREERKLSAGRTSRQQHPNATDEDSDDIAPTPASETILRSEHEKHRLARGAEVQV